MERCHQTQTMLLVSVMTIWQQLADFLEDAEPNHDLRNNDLRNRKFYRHLNAHSLMLMNEIRKVQSLESTENLEILARPLLKKFASFLRFSVLPSYETRLPISEPYPRLTTLIYYRSLYDDLEVLWENMKDCIDLDSEDIKDELVLLLRGCVSTLRSLSYEIPSGRKERFLISRKERKAITHSARNAADKVFNILVASSKACSALHHQHECAARLRLATYQTNMEEQYAFETFITLGLQHQAWQETQIRVKNLRSEQKKESMMKFAMESCEPVTERERLQRRRLAVERLCEQIEKIKSQPAMRLNLVEEDGKLWKIQSTKSGFILNRSESPLSLREIILSRPTSLTEKVKRILAVFLAYSVLHLHGTPWVSKSSFHAENIIFFPTSTTVPLKPFIHANLSEADRNSNRAIMQNDDMGDEIDPDDIPLHPFPHIVSLAIMLMELYMAQPIESLAEQADVQPEDWKQVNENTTYSVALAVFEHFKDDLTDKYRQAVDTCLDSDIQFNDDGEERKEEAMKTVIYEEIVQPLKDELDQGFGNVISVDSLDEAAEKLDLNLCSYVRQSRQQFIGVEHFQVSSTFKQSNSKLIYSTPMHTDLADKAPEIERPPNDHVDKPLLHDSLRSKQSGSSTTSSTATLSHSNFRIGWICALPIEMAVAEAMLDETYDDALPQGHSDMNNYILGRIGVHKVVIACLPSGVYGTVAASRVAEQMRGTFESLKFGLLVGIGGGAPGVQDVRLGDVVIGEPSGSIGGVIQYDFGKTVNDCRFHNTGSLNRPPDILLTAATRLKAKHYVHGPKIGKYLENMIAQNPSMSADFSHPGVQHDTLFACEYDHRENNVEGSCENCDHENVVQRIPRNSTVPQIHYGIIASGNQVMRHGATRERWREKFNVLCFEMEAAGLVDAFPCLVIRGICDYSDTHKNKRWQGYAAATAAAYAKELLSIIPAFKSD